MRSIASVTLLAAIAANLGAPALATEPSYNGSWPVTISKSQFANGMGCITLSGSGRGGSAKIVLDNQQYGGAFVVRDGIVIVSLTEPLYGQNGVLTLTAHAGGGRIGHGIYENLEGGSEFDIGDVAFGMKNSC